MLEKQLLSNFSAAASAAISHLYPVHSAMSNQAAVSSMRSNGGDDDDERGSGRIIA